jgi:hypothetical protein
MHPFGEHINPFGQHPPPVAAEHSIVDDKHFGGWKRDSLQADSGAVELQQNIFEGVNLLGWQIM